ncbi:MAG: lysophospholipid acyltransferase family protein [Rhodobacteraceae bacterium]|nr:lysophospholipid acyltransferase family protein [Paracoccaceae bacterium]
MAEDPEYVPYDGRNLSYAGTFEEPFKANVIRVIEWVSGKITLMRLVRRFEATGRRAGQSFWGKTLELLDIRLDTPAHEVQRIPAEGPVVVVANHPHGLVDGLVLAELIGRVRPDFKILTRSLLTNVPEIQYHMLPVAFPHEADSVRKNVEMRKLAMEHLRDGGVVVLFPAGQVAAAPSWMAQAVEAEWNPFTAKMLLKSDAKVLPIYFPGQNSRLYHWANLVSPTLRQSLLLHEIVHAMHKPQRPVIGELIAREEIEAFPGNTTAFMAWLRARVLALGEGARGEGLG